MNNWKDTDKTKNYFKEDFLGLSDKISNKKL